MPKQYSKCPKCGREDFGDGIYTGDLQIDGDDVWKVYECNCGFSWQEVYTFSHNETIDACAELDENGNVILKADNANKKSDNADNADSFDEDAAEERIMDIGDK